LVARQLVLGGPMEFVVVRASPQHAWTLPGGLIDATHAAHVAPGRFFAEQALGGQGGQPIARQ
jgi:hypothetical protein